MWSQNYQDWSLVIIYWNGDFTCYREHYRKCCRFQRLITSERLFDIEVWLNTEFRMGSDNTLGLVSQVEGCGFCLGNGNISAAYLCPAAGGGMNAAHWRWFCVWIPEHSQTFLPKEVEERHRSFFKVILFGDVTESGPCLSFIFTFHFLSSKRDPNEGRGSHGAHSAWENMAVDIGLQLHCCPQSLSEGQSPRMSVTRGPSTTGRGWAVASVLWNFPCFYFHL